MTDLEESIMAKFHCGRLTAQRIARTVLYGSSTAPFSAADRGPVS